MAYNLYLLAILGSVILFIAKKVVAYVQARRFIKEHGCQPVRRMPQSERIIGWELFKISRAAHKNKKLLATNLQRYADNGDTWSATLIGETFYNTREPENVKAVLATNFKDFGLGTRLKSFGPLLGRGIFTSDGAHWEHSRALVRPNFTRAQVADLDTFETHIQHLISRIPLDGSTIDLQDLFFRLTLDSATEFLFGSSVNSLTAPAGSPSLRFGKAFDLAQSKLPSRGRLGKLMMFYSDPDFDDACKTVHAFVDQIVFKALQKPVLLEKAEDLETGRYVFLDEMVKATRDPEQLRSELLNILLAGRDTTASLLSHTWHELARRPDILKKLQAEVDELRGRQPTYEDIKGMKYLKWLLTESLRLYPVVPSNARFAVRDTTIPVGGGLDGKSPVYIPAGSVVVYSVYGMHRRKDIYGADAEVFRPERWAPEEALRPGWGYLPFNGGPRICVGQQFALTEASYTTIRLLQAFKGIENRDPGPWVEQLALTLATANGVKVAMIPT